MSPRSPVTPTERLILTTLRLSDVPMSIVEVAEAVECSPLTVRLALQKLTKSNTVNRTLQGQKAYYTSTDFKIRTSEDYKFDQWMAAFISKRTYAEAVDEGIAAFVLIGVKHSKAKVKEAFPQTHEGMSSLAHFIWDVTQNDTRATRRLVSLLPDGFKKTFI